MSIIIKFYRKLKICYKTLAAVLFLVLWLTYPSKAQETKTGELFLLQKDGFNSYAEFISDDLKDFFNPAAGNAYPSTNLFDGDFKSCWVCNSSKTAKNATLYVCLPEKIATDKLILNIFSGYGKSKKLFVANARPKKIKLSLYAAFQPDGFSTETANLYFVKKYPLHKTITLADTFAVQSFALTFDKKSLQKFQKEALTQAKSFSGANYNKMKGDNAEPKSFSPAFILKLEVSDIYKGTKYQDVCISELFFNDRFVTPYPDGYKKISGIDIKNDNTLIANIGDKKSIVIYKDTSSVFTFADWPKNTNWLILHYVENKATGESMRTEEQYLLFDLKNRKAVNTEFEKYTGNSLMFQVLETGKSGKVFIDNGKYRIELK